jgi:hypothetical protein
MLRLRSLRGWGGRIALLALWLQLGLAFGHIHPDDIYGPLGHPVIADHGVTEIVPHGPATPLGPFAPPLADQFCPICANMALAASLVMPPAVRLPPAPAIAMPAAVRPTPPLLVAAPHLLFQTRAPPLA